MSGCCCWLHQLISIYHCLIMLRLLCHASSHLPSALAADGASTCTCYQHVIIIACPQVRACDAPCNNARALVHEFMEHESSGGNNNNR